MLEKCCTFTTVTYNTQKFCSNEYICTFIDVPHITLHVPAVSLPLSHSLSLILQQTIIYPLYSHDNFTTISKN
jgi:hypothetical protein